LAIKEFTKEYANEPWPTWQKWLLGFLLATTGILSGIALLTDPDFAEPNYPL
jgi:hypothetical protein